MDNEEHTSDIETYVTVPLTIVWLLLIFAVVMTYFLQRSGFSKILPPSVGALVLGLVIGIILKVAGVGSHNNPYTFHGAGFAAGFFYGLLPPIVFGAGFTLKKRKFFQNFGAITMFAVFGTIISTIVFGVITYLLALMGAIRAIGKKPFVNSMLYGSLISAIDPVATLSVFQELDAPPLLYNLVFGESVLNDAVSIVLFKSFEAFLNKDVAFTMLFGVIWRFLYISFGSLAVGISIALVSAFVLKRFNPAKSNGHEDGVTYEISMVLMAAYFSYLAAEVSGLSGIVALFFSAIVHAHYSFYNISDEAQIATAKMINVMVFLLETAVFLYLGLQVALLKSSQLDAGLIVSGMPLIMLSRAANVYPLAYLVNKFRRFPIPYPLQTVQWACGLRGAVAYALALLLSARTQDVDAIESATLLIVVISTVIFGAGTGSIMRSLGLQGADDYDVQNMLYGQLSGVGSSESQRPQRQDSAEMSAFHRRWDNLDNNYLKPIFGGKVRLHRGSVDGAGLLDSEQRLDAEGLEVQMDQVPSSPTGPRNSGTD